MPQNDLTEWDQDLITSPDEDYEALLRAIRWAKGFGLLFVQCSPAEGERLIDRVKADITEKTVNVLRLEDEIEDLYETVAVQPDIDKTQVLFITGLEKSLVPYIKPGYGSEGDYYSHDTVPKILGKLNLQRERFKNTFKLVFVFLVPPYAMKYLIRRAPDFFDWRAGVWEFVDSQDILCRKSQKILEKAKDYKEYLSWTPQQRKEHFFVVQDLIDQGSHSMEEINNLLLDQARILQINQTFQEALACYEKILRTNPKDYQAVFGKGNVLYGLGLKTEAIDCYEKVLAIQPAHYEALYNKGIVMSDLGHCEQAIACYDRALEVEPNYYEAVYNKGVELSSLGRYEEAINCYNKVLSIKPNYWEAFLNKCVDLSALGRFDEVIACYDQVIVTQPSNYEALSGKGNALSALGRYEEAIICYDKALVFQPDDHKIFNNKGNALSALGRYEEAIICYDKALVLQPDDHKGLFNKRVAMLFLGL